MDWLSNQLQITHPSVEWYFISIEDIHNQKGGKTFMRTFENSIGKNNVPLLYVYLYIVVLGIYNLANQINKFCNLILFDILSANIILILI